MFTLSLVLLLSSDHQSPPRQQQLMFVIRLTLAQAPAK